MLLNQSCVVLEMPDGDRRLVVAGKPYRLRPGEKVIGADPTCGQAPVSQKTPPAGDFKVLKDEIDLAVGPGAGDWIKTMAKPLAKWAGRDGCTACEARRIATNAYAQLKGKYGMIKGMAIIKELWELSFKAEPDEVLAKLKEYLG